MGNRSLHFSLFRVLFRAYSVVLFEPIFLGLGRVVGSTEKIGDGG